MRHLCAGNIIQSWVVLKFGGTSVSSAANWHNIADVITGPHRRILQAGRRSFRALGHHRPPRIAAGGRAGRNALGGSRANRCQASRSRRARTSCPASSSSGFMRSCDDMADGLARRPRTGRRLARARHVHGRTAGDRLGRDIPECPGHRHRLGGCPAGAARGNASRRDAEIEPAVGHLRFCAGWAAAGAVAGAGPGSDHPGFHRGQRSRRHRAAGPRRIGYLGLLLRGQIERGAPGDLDRRTRMFSANPRAVPTARLLRASALR